MPGAQMQIMRPSPANRCIPSPARTVVSGPAQPVFLAEELYREAWLTENRPYWLDNVLVRNDLQLQLWQKRGDDLNQLIDTWQETKALPTSDQAGIPTAP
jgi:hypothetical protein